MMRSFFVALTPFLLVLPVCADQPAYVIETKPTKAIEAVMTLEITTPKLKAKEWVLFTPRLLELPGQTDVKSKMNFASEKVLDLSPLKRPLLRARVKVTNKDIESKITVVTTYEAQLHSRKLVPLKPGDTPPKVEALPDAERKLFLRATEMINFDADAFKKWLKDNNLQRAKDESDLDYGRRVFRFLAGTFTYEYKLKMDRTATAVCKAGKSDCSGMSVVFATAMRGHGIPARLRVGRWAQSAKPADKLGEVLYTQQHAWAEFFCEGIGWVPVDPSMEVINNKGKTDKLQWFGHDRGNFVTLHLDPMLVVDTAIAGKQTLPWLQIAAYWVSGAGNVDGAVYVEGWVVKEVK